LRHSVGPGVGLKRTFKEQIQIIVVKRYGISRYKEPAIVKDKKPMGTLAQILARLDKLEARLAPAPVVEIDTRDVRRQLDLIAERRRAMPGWKPSDVGLAEVIEAARNALVFVHGFNTKYDDGIYRLARIAWDLKFKGMPILFSWPSYGDGDGNLTGILHYSYDRNSALNSQELFVRLLNLLLADGKIKTLHVIAHSMGNFVMLEALNLAARDNPPIRLSEVVMAAPDVDRDRFSDLASRVQKVTRGMTLYASSKDRAMLAAREFARAPRAGDAPPQAGPIVVSGVDTIDVSVFGSELFGINHDTFASNRSLIDDIGHVLRGERPPHVRTPQIRGVPEGQSPPRYCRYPQ
jgi:esterase/lipase superfamily enzyme